MLQQGETWVQKMMEQLGELGISAKEMEDAESYLCGDAKDEVLTHFTQCDFTNSSTDFTKIITTLDRKAEKEELRRVFQLLFAIGKSTAFYTIKEEYLRYNIFFHKIERYALGPVMETALGVCCLTEKDYHITHENLLHLGKRAGNPENVLKAADYQVSPLDNERLLLYTLYFAMKYPYKKNEKEIVLPENEKKILEKYEADMVDSLGNLFANKLSSKDLETLSHALYEDAMDPAVLSIVQKSAMNTYLVRLLGGCAFCGARLSKVLRNMVCLISAADDTQMLSTMEKMDIHREFRDRGADLDDKYGIDSKKCLLFAVQGNHPILLRAMYEKHKELYLEVYKEEVDFERGERMLMQIRAVDPDACKKLLDEGEDRQKEKLISIFVLNRKDIGNNVVGRYLSGETDMKELCAYSKELWNGSYYAGYNMSRALGNYICQYSDEPFIRRCEIIFLMIGSGCFFYDLLVTRDPKKGVISFEKKALEKLYADFETEGVPAACQLHMIPMMEEQMSGDRKTGFLECSREIFCGYLKERREETLEAFRNAEAVSRAFALTVLREDTKGNHDEILAYTKDTAKAVISVLLEIVKDESVWKEDVEKLLLSKKAGEREIAVRTLAEWKVPGLGEKLKAVLETEKNAKVRALLMETLGEDAGADAKESLSGEQLVKELHKGGKKRTLEWAYETPFSAVHMANGAQAEEEYLQAVLLCYSSMGNLGVNEDAKRLAGDLNAGEFAVYVNELLDKWIEKGAEAKKKWVLFATAIHGGSDAVKKLHHQIQEWPKEARGAIACQAVQALALSPQPDALLIVDGIARKFKFKQVKAAAGNALDYAAEQLGLTRAQLEDRIVPDLGFDKNMERVFDYGSRTFTVSITPALELEILADTGKKVKNLPSPGAKDDEEKAKEAYAAFKQMKKDMKTVVSSQKMRLEMALSTAREWSVENWKHLFVENPVMHQFAIGLIWGVYDNHNLVSSFRYMEDGTFNTADEEEYELPADGKIGLVHPIELDEELRKTWSEQLEDYEIIQPFEQLKREIYYMSEEEKESRSMERFGGYMMSSLSLNGKLLGMGWYRGSVIDGGGFLEYYREDAELGIGVELNFSGTYVGGYYDEDITVYDARFYKAGTVARGSYVYDNADDSKAYQLKDVPKRYFSEIVYQLAKATASSTEKNENWKKEYRR